MRLHLALKKDGTNKRALQRALAFITALLLIATLSMCGKNETGLPSKRSNELTLMPTQKDAPENSYVYPENPAVELHDALISAITKHRLPIKVSDVERVSFEDTERTEITLHFMNGSNNTCVISFELRNLSYDISYSLDGHDNPSFTMAFKDRDNSQDMITILTLVLQYISPGLSDEEARQLARQQDTTISIDSYSQPLDIEGYQVVARYTNPQLFLHTQEFDSELGVKVTAIKQIWGEVDTSRFKKLKTRQDYSVITSGYTPWETNKKTKAIYADFIIKNVWHYKEEVHGDNWVEVDVESMTGDQYTLRVETMRMIMNYEFGVGQKYTLYIRTGTYYGANIVYAIERSSSSKPNSIGVAHAMEYSTPNDPIRDGYEFLGWFDNVERAGSPYTKDTPIYRDTNLYAKWKYIGTGGTSPRAHRGEIEGISEGGSYNAGQTLSIIADGYNMHLSKPKDQRFRLMPVSFRLLSGASGNFSVEAPFTADLSLLSTGKQKLYVTYLEEIFDGAGWQGSGQLYEVEEVTFKVK